MFWRRHPQKPVGGGLTQLRETKQPRVLRKTNKTTHHLGLGHVAVTATSLLCGRTANTESPLTRDPIRILWAAFPGSSVPHGMPCSLACLVEQTLEPDVASRHHSHTQSSGERIFPSMPGSLHSLEHRLRRSWSFWKTLVPASCRPTSARGSCCDNFFVSAAGALSSLHFGSRRSPGTGTGLPASPSPPHPTVERPKLNEVPVGPSTQGECKHGKYSGRGPRTATSRHLFVPNCTLVP